MDSAAWAEELNEDLDRYDGVDDQIDYAIGYGATLGGITVDQSRCDRAGRRLVSIEFPTPQAAIGAILGGSW